MAEHPLTQQWLKSLSNVSRSTSSDRPSWRSNPNSLISSGNIHSLWLGTGESIYVNSILPVVETAEQEVILVTCFWARSKTRDALSDSLLNLSAKGQRLAHPIRIRIYFSSSSLTQKLFHPQSLKGRTWEPSTWRAKLGLPSGEELPGLEMQIKSVFLLPFSVMHPKFVILDRTRVLLPSCNVSWEDWFEGCVELSGDVVEHFVRFWREFWATEGDSRTEGKALLVPDGESFLRANRPKTLASRYLDLRNVQALFLPSPHHRNPQFAFLPWQPCPSPPATPLNVFLLEAIKSAQNSIYIQTPNLTAPPILSALLAALRRGVDVTVLTSEKLMKLEQLVTAGTTTARCMRKLIKLYKRIPGNNASSSNEASLLESGNQPGNLTISYYQPLAAHLRGKTGPEPVQSHLKLTIIDEEWTILGSGNLDRASLFTSQELGVAFCSKELAQIVKGQVDGLMEGRRKTLFRGNYDG